MGQKRRKIEKWGDEENGIVINMKKVYRIYVIFGVRVED